MVEDWLVRGMLFLVGMGFVGWSAVVWRATAMARDLAREVVVRLEAVTADLDRIEQRLSDHEKLPWHGAIGARVENIEKDIARLESRIERFHPPHGD